MMDRKARLHVGPLKLDGQVPFRPSYSFDLPQRGGVYLIYDLRGCLYIGRTDDLYDRFDTHHDYSHNPQLRYALRHPVGVIDFAWILAESTEQMDLERRLIRDLEPLCNDIRYTTSKET